MSLEKCSAWCLAARVALVPLCPLWDLQSADWVLPRLSLALVVFPVVPQQGGYCAAPIFTDVYSEAEAQDESPRPRGFLLGLCPLCLPGQLGLTSSGFWRRLFSFAQRGGRGWGCWWELGGRPGSAWDPPGRAGTLAWVLRLGSCSCLPVGEQLAGAPLTCVIGAYPPLPVAGLCGGGRVIPLLGRWWRRGSVTFRSSVCGRAGGGHGCPPSQCQQEHEVHEGTGACLCLHPPHCEELAGNNSREPPHPLPRDRRSLGLEGRWLGHHRV